MAPLFTTYNSRNKQKINKKFYGYPKDIKVLTEQLRANEFINSYDNLFANILYFGRNYNIDVLKRNPDFIRLDPVVKIPYERPRNRQDKFTSIDDIEYNYDKDLSTRDVAVYGPTKNRDDNNKIIPAIVSYRGTSVGLNKRFIQDAGYNILNAIGFNTVFGKYNNRINEAEKIAKEARQKYGRVELTGHSAGGDIARDVVERDTGFGITKATLFSPGGFVPDLTKNSDKISSITSTADVFNILAPLSKEEKKNEIVFGFPGIAHKAGFNQDIIYGQLRENLNNRGLVKYGPKPTKEIFEKGDLTFKLPALPIGTVTTKRRKDEL